MNSLRITRSVFLAILFGLVLSACGSASDPATDGATGTTPAPPSTMTSEMDHEDGMDHEDDDDHSDHQHGVIEWDGGAVPSVEIEVVEDSVKGYNVFASVTGYRFAPENASGDHIPGEGHAHLYVDGQKIARVYGTGFHIPKLDPGSHEITYGLSANTHDDYVIDGEPIASSVTVEVVESEESGHSHGAETRAWDGAEDLSISITIEEDAKSGWNLIADMTGYTLTPEAVGGDHVPGEGHAHIYVNGVKSGRVYNAAAHLTELPVGEVTIEYRLSGNDHVEYDEVGVATISVSDEDGVTTDQPGHDAVVIEIVGGEVRGGPQTVEVELGSMAHITVESDEAVQVHVHGYDLFFDAAPGSPAEIMFVADVPGVFEIELEGPHTLIAELEVS